MGSREGGAIRTDCAGRSGGRVRLPGIRAARSGVLKSLQGCVECHATMIL